MDEEITEVVVDTQAVRSMAAPLVLLGASVGLAVGVLVGYKWASKRLEAVYARISEDEIAEAKSFYAKLHKGGDFSTPEKAAAVLRPEVEAAADAMLEYQGRSDDSTPPDPRDHPEVMERSNIFVESKSKFVWDQEHEESLRTEEEPFVLHEDEWMEGCGYKRVDLFYYAGDETLTDEGDDPIPTVDDTVGLANLQRFGQGTQDARTLFVRNDRLRSDFQIILHDGKYAHEVLGLQHADSYDQRRRPVRRMRPDG